MRWAIAAVNSKVKGTSPTWGDGRPEEEARPGLRRHRHDVHDGQKIGFKKIAFGSDIVTDPEMLKRINEEFVQRTRWFKAAEILRQATGNNGELMALSGKRNPYPGKLGVIEEGALADILLIDGNPLENIEILTNYEENLVLIMKDGRIYKNLINGKLDPVVRERIEGVVGPLK